MIPVKNSRTTPYDVGDYIKSTYYGTHGRPSIYKIIELRQCASDGIPPCRECSSGNVAYVTKRFNKRLGIRPISLCPMRNGHSDWIKTNSRGEVE